MHYQPDVTLKGEHIEASIARNRSSWDVRTYLHRMEQPVATTHFAWRTPDDVPTDSWLDDLYPDEATAFDAATRLLTVAVGAGPDRSAVNAIIEAFCNGESAHVQA